MGASSIEWTDATWNPTVGCTKVSPGCKHCFAKTMHARLTAMGQRKYAEPFEAVRPWPDDLGKPLTWKKPRRIFVNSQSDLFHEDLPDEYIAAVFGVMAACPQHTFQVLTKRAERLSQWFEWVECQAASSPDPRSAWARADVCQRAALDFGIRGILHPIKETLRAWPWPLPNVWLGVSVEDQKRADERIPHLLRVPAAVRFLSCEPLLEAVTLWRFDDEEQAWRGPGVIRSGGMTPSTPSEASEGYDDSYVDVDWVIVGGESGHGARRFNAEWARSIVKQCRAAGVPVFVKQMGAVVIDRNDRFNTCGDTSPACDGDWPLDDPDAVEHDINGYREEYQGAPVRIRLRDKKGGDMNEWPPELRVREFPEVRR